MISDRLFTTTYIVMKRAYKFKLKPTCKQQQKLLQHFGCARYIYNWGLDMKKIAVQHRRIANRRLNFLHKLSTNLIRTYSSICLEDLNVKGMMKNHCLANGISSVAWNEFVRQLTYKSDWYGRNVIFIGRFEPSSKTCNHCGYVNCELTLKDREWTCPQCGELLDRDVNAALNIKKMGLQQSQVR